MRKLVFTGLVTDTFSSSFSTPNGALESLSEKRSLPSDQTLPIVSFCLPLLRECGRTLHLSEQPRSQPASKTRIPHSTGSNAAMSPL